MITYDEREPVVRNDDMGRLRSYENDLMNEIHEYGPDDQYKNGLRSQLEKVRDEIRKQGLKLLCSGVVV